MTPPPDYPPPTFDGRIARREADMKIPYTMDVDREVYGVKKGGKRQVPFRSIHANSSQEAAAMLGSIALDFAS